MKAQTRLCISKREVGLDIDGDATSDDLASLLACFTSEELAPLYEMATRKVSEELSFNERVKHSRPQHSAYSDLIAHEIRLFGGNSFANLGRGGEGPPYAEIVRDVCRSRKVKVKRDASVIAMEQALLSRQLDSLPADEQHRIRQEMAAAGLKGDLSAIPLSVLALQVGGQLSGFLLYETGLQVANGIARAVIGQGISFLGNQMLVRGLAIATGPIGLSITGALALGSLAGPAKTVTVPAVHYIGAIRQKKLWESALAEAA